MKISATFSVGLVLIGTIAGCKPQHTIPLSAQAAQSKDLMPLPVSAQAAQSKDFTPLPASTATPVKSSLAVLAKWKSVGDLSVPSDNDSPGRPIFSPDAKWIAAPGSGWAGKNGSHGEKGLIFVWDSRTRSLAKKLEVPTNFGGPLNNLIWSPDSKQVAAWLVGSNSTSPLFVWNVASGNLQSSIRNQKLGVSSACFFEEGKLLVAWNNALDSSSEESRISVENKGKREMDLELKNRSAVAVARTKGPPLESVAVRL